MSRLRRIRTKKHRIRRLIFTLILSLSVIFAVTKTIDSYLSRRPESKHVEAGIDLVKETKPVISDSEENSEPAIDTPAIDTPAIDTPKKGTSVKEAFVKSEISPVAECTPLAFGYVRDIMKDNKIIEQFVREHPISFGSPEKYNEVAGVTCFRGNNYRNSASYGFADIKEEKLEKVWFAKIGYMDVWTGVGWNGQPAIVKWNDNVKSIMNIKPDKKAKKDLKEVIYATLDGNIYFLDLEDGLPTRSPIEVGSPHKGSVSIDPRGYPLLYAGQGIDDIKGKRIEIGYRIFSLIDHKLLYFINGFDSFAFRRWGAFDSTALIDRKTDTMIEPGENGILYTVKLNTDFKPDKGSISIRPEVVKQRYNTKDKRKLGTENSAAIYENYAYFADNGGLLQCLDLNTMEPVWVRDVTDDTDSTIVLEKISDSEVYLYTACEVDSQGVNGKSYIRKIDAFSGRLMWEKAVDCYYDSHVNGGALATPVVGKEDIKDLVIFNIAKTGKPNGGKLIAMDKKTGNEVWQVELEYYCWSSPVDVYTPQGKSYIIVCDSGGYMRLLEGTSGKILHSIPLEANIEASPAVYEDMIVVGTRGQKIWGVRLK